MKRKFFVDPSEEPTPDQVQQLIKAARTIEPELVTVIRMAYESGITPGISRFLKWELLEGDSILLKHHNSKLPRRRRLPRSLLNYLNELQRTGPYICPRLSVHRNIGNLYRTLWNTVKGRVSAKSLVWRWEREHEREMKMEEIYAYLEQLASEFLTKAQFIAIQISMEILQRLPPTKQSNRRRTREEILADL